jgi:hypothetical protein
MLSEGRESVLASHHAGRAFVYESDEVLGWILEFSRMPRGEGKLALAWLTRTFALPGTLCPPHATVSVSFVVLAHFCALGDCPGSVH